MSIRIVKNRYGFSLRVDDYFLNAIDLNEFKYTKDDANIFNNSAPYDATVFVSVRAVRNFWNCFKNRILFDIALKHITVSKSPTIYRYKSFAITDNQLFQYTGRAGIVIAYSHLRYLEYLDWKAEERFTKNYPHLNP